MTKKPDNVVFNEELQQYDAFKLSYPTNIGGFKFDKGKSDITRNSQSSNAHSIIRNKIIELIEEVNNVKQLYDLNEFVYNCIYNFEPKVGETYHIYRNDFGECFLSIINPNEWDKDFVMSVKLNSDYVWNRII